MNVDKRIEEFSLEGKSFLYVNLSGLDNNDDFDRLFEKAKPVFAKHPFQTLHTVTNIHNIFFDANTSDLLFSYLEHNKAYVKRGAVFGIDGIKKQMINSALAQTDRDSIHYAFTKEEAIQWLLQQED